MPGLEAHPKPTKQVAALPVVIDAKGTTRVLLITSRRTKRLIVPKGWPMKGKKDHHAAAIEAREEAGLIGRVHQKPIGSYAYWKRRADRFEYVKVKVFVLEVRRQLIDWREKGQRRGVWLPIDDAAELVSEPGLVTIIDDLSATLATPTARAVLGKLPKKEVRKANAGATSVAAVNSVSGD